MGCKEKSYDVREGVVSNEYLGNFMYGLAGSVLGIEDRILVSAAAGQQQYELNLQELDKILNCA